MADGSNISDVQAQLLARRQAQVEAARQAALAVGGTTITNPDGSVTTLVSAHVKDGSATSTIKPPVVPTGSTQQQSAVAEEIKQEEDANAGKVATTKELTAEEEDAARDARILASMTQYPNVDYDKTKTGVPPTPENYAAWNKATNPNNATPNTKDWDQFQADLAIAREAHESGKIDDYDFNDRVDKITSAYTSGNYAANVGDALSGLVEVPDTQVSGAGTGIGTNATPRNMITIDDYVGNYGGRGARLTQFIYADGTDDDDRLAYLQLVVPGNLMSNIATGANKQAMEALYAMVKDKYNRFIVNTLQENRQERSSIIKTVGDSFAVTFSGREPMVIHVSGSLVFDYDRTRMSWYTAFMNAYEYYLRASQTAKYHAKVKLVFPDFTEYTGYILSVSSAQSSDSDLMVPFNFSMLVINESFNKAYSYTDSDGLQTIATTPNSALSQKDAETSISESVRNTASDAVDSAGNSIANAATDVSSVASAVGKEMQSKISASTATASKAATGTGGSAINLNTLTNVLVGNSNAATANFKKYKSYYQSIGAKAASIGVRLPKI